MRYSLNAETGRYWKSLAAVIVLTVAVISQGCIKDFRRTPVEMATDDSAMTEFMEQDAIEDSVATEEVMPKEDHLSQDTLEHVIQYPGENLALIAQWYTGKFANWPAILEVNPGVVPTALRLGQVIFIPRHLMIRDEPMPQSHVRPPSTGPSRSTGNLEQPSDSAAEVHEPSESTQTSTEMKFPHSQPSRSRKCPTC